MVTSMHQNPDGSWSQAQPLGWQGGYDWEVYRESKPMCAHLYDEDVLIAKVRANGPRRLAWKMRREQRRLGITKASVL